MAMARGGRSSGRRRGSGRRHSKTKPISDINVTPMVDVMLVLLVVFMVTAPLLTVGVQVDLPKTKAGLIQENVEPLAVTIKADGQIYLQDAAIDISALVPRLIAITGTNPDIRLFVRGDKSVEYGRVMEVMGTLNAAGFRKVALITEMPQSSTKKTSGKKRRKNQQSKTGKK